MSKVLNLFERVYKSDVENYLHANFPNNRFTEPIHYMLGFPRNYFRAALPIVLGNSFGAHKERMLPISTTAEILFAISLAQDDIIDLDETRNERPAAWKKFGLPKCVASIDYSYYHAIKILGKLKEFPLAKNRLPRIYNSHLESHRMVNESFILEEDNVRNFELSIDDLLRIYEDKTVAGTNALFSAALAIDSLSDKECENVREYAKLVAFAGQIKNDVVDFHPLKGYDDYRKLSDFKRGYVNYPILKFFEVCSETEKEKLKKIYGVSGPEEAVAMLSKHDIALKCMEDCQRFTEVALEKIDFIPDREGKEVLKDWAISNTRFNRANWP